MPFHLHLAPFAQIQSATLYRILQLRSRVFVVEQRAAYDELDGRDLEESAVHLWAEEAGQVVGTLRILIDSDAFHIGRVVTA